MLGRDIVGRPHYLRQVSERQTPRPGQGRDSKIDHFDAAFIIHHDVFGFQITMRYALVVHVVERLQYTEDDGYSDLLRHRLFCDDLAQGPSLYPLHHSVESTPHGHFIHLHYAM